MSLHYILFLLVEVNISQWRLSQWWGYFRGDSAKQNVLQKTNVWLIAYWYTNDIFASYQSRTTNVMQVSFYDSFNSISTCQLSSIKTLLFLSFKTDDHEC